MKLLQLASFAAGVMLAFNLAAQTNTNQIITVKVQDASGKPIAGATVEYYTSVGIATNQPRAEVTGSDGQVKFAAAADWGEVLARKTGLSFAIAYCNRTGSLVLTLGQPVAISGVVVDESDKPVPDATVGIATLCSAPPLTPEVSYVGTQLLGDVLATRTDADGRFRIDGLATNSAVDLFATKSGKALVEPKRDHFGADTMMGRAGQQDIKLKMLPGGSIEGKILFPEEGKMPQVYLGLLDQTRQKSTTAESDGSFRFEDLAAGNYRIFSLFGTNKFPEWVAQYPNVTVEAGKVTRNVKITAVRGGVLEVATFSKAGHKPMRDVSIYAQNGTGLAETINTGEDSTLRARLLPGRYRVEANKDGWQSKSTSVEIEEGKTNRVEIELAPPPQLGGTVRDTNGAPVPNIEVRLYPNWGSEPTVKTDTNGHFQTIAVQLPQGQGMVPFLMVRDRDRNLAAACDIEDGTESYSLQLTPALVVTGRVQTEQGKPLTNASLTLFVWTGTSGWDVEDEKSIKCDAQGRFEIGALPMGRRYSMNISAKGYGSASPNIQSDRDRFELEPISLRVAEKKIAGVVVDLENKPVKGANGYIYGDGQPNTSFKTDEKGRFAIDEVCDGTLTVTASIMGNSDNCYGSVRVEAGDTNIVLTLGQQPRSLRSRPSRASLVGEPLPDLTAAGISSEAIQTNKPFLICLFDLEQRPSRRVLRLLSEQHDVLKQKGLTVVAISAALTTADALKEWKQSNPQPFPVGGVTETTDRTKWLLKTEKFPWLILTDAQGRIRAEGFDLGELDAKLNSK